MVHQTPTAAHQRRDNLYSGNSESGLTLQHSHTHHTTTTTPPTPPTPPEMGKDKLTYSYYFTNLLEIINCCLFLPQASVLFQFYFSTFILRHSQPPSSDLHDLCIFSTWVSSVFHRGSLRPHRAERVHLPFCCSGTGKLLTVAHVWSISLYTSPALSHYGAQILLIWDTKEKFQQH